MAEITDEYMRGEIANIKVYALCLLHKGPAYGSEGSEKIIWEHGRNNFKLREAGKLCVMGPIQGDSELRGTGIFSTSVDEATTIMEADPAIQAGIFTFEIYPFRSFPGSALA